MQDGAPYHRAAAVKTLIAQHAKRLTVTHLPSYSPDYNPIEYLWRATKREATHNPYFPAFTNVVASVEQTLAELTAQPTWVRSLFTLYVEQQVSQPSSFSFSPLPHAA